MISLSVTISGHSELGSNVKVGPGSTINNRSKIGENATIGIGSLVLHPIVKNSIVIGRPATEIAEQKKMTKAMRRLIGSQKKSTPVTSAAPKLRKFKNLFRPIFNLLPKKMQHFVKKILLQESSDGDD